MEILEQLNTIIDTQRTRYFRFQKVVFLSEIKTILEKKEIETHLLTDVYRNQKYHSLVIGNIKNANKVVITHYDTSSLIHDLFKFESFEIKKRQKISLTIDVFKSIMISSLACIFLFILIQNILDGNNIIIYSILSLILFLISVYLIRLPILLPSLSNENKNTLKYLFKRVVEDNPNTSYVIVDDGICYQMGYKILSKYLKQANKKYDFELLDQINEKLNVNPIEVNEMGDTRMKYFDGLKAKAYTS